MSLDSFRIQAAATRWLDLDARDTTVPAGSPPARVSETRQALFQDGAALLGFGPDSREVRDLVQRWRAVVDEESGGDETTKAELLAGFRHRVYWPPGLLRTVAASYRIDAKTWAAVADLVEAAHDGMTGPTAFGRILDA